VSSNQCSIVCRISRRAPPHKRPYMRFMEHSSQSCRDAWQLPRRLDRYTPNGGQRRIGNRRAGKKRENLGAEEKCPGSGDDHRLERGFGRSFRRVGRQVPVEVHIG
jgi:hypothetical protein